MRILIITSKDHIYANYVIKSLLQKNVFNGDALRILEQDAIIPGKKKREGLLKYLKVAGFNYTASQIIKQYIFLTKKSKANLQSNKDSSFYSYKKLVQDKVVQSGNDINSNATQQKIKQFNPDLILSIYSKEIIPEKIIQLPKYGCINTHPAYLPFYKGVSPTFWVLVNNEKTTGSTLHYLDKGIDTGRIISQEEISIEPGETEHHLYLKCSKSAILQIGQYLNTIKRGEKIKSIPQLDAGSYYSLPQKNAVKRFKQSGYQFFELNEFFRQ